MVGDNWKDVGSRHRRPCPQPSGQLGSRQPCVGECRDLVYNTINPKSTLRFMQLNFICGYSQFSIFCITHEVENCVASKNSFFFFYFDTGFL